MLILLTKRRKQGHKRSAPNVTWCSKLKLKSIRLAMPSSSSLFLNKFERTGTTRSELRTGFAAAQRARCSLFKLASSCKLADIAWIIADDYCL